MYEFINIWNMDFKKPNPKEVVALVLGDRVSLQSPSCP